MALPQDLGTCKSYENLYIISADFLRDAAAEYQKQFDFQHDDTDSA
jgi:hypothetical protein